MRMLRYVAFYLYAHFNAIHNRLLRGLRLCQRLGPETENDREPMDCLTDGTASLLRYDDRRRQLDLLCMTGVHTALHSSVRYAGARPFIQR